MLKFLRYLIFFWFDLKGWIKIIVGMTLGVLVGLILEEKAILLQPLGTLFINSITMMVVPVVFVSLVSGVVSMKDPIKLGRIALKTFSLYGLTMAISTLISLLLCTFAFHPGLGVRHHMQLPSPETLIRNQEFDFIQGIVNLVPTNIFGAFYEGNILQIIVIALLFGFSITLAGSKAKPVEDLFEALSEVVFKFVAIVMHLAPYGIFALMAVVAGTNGYELIKSLIHMVGVVYLSMCLGMITIYGGGLLAAGLAPKVFFKKMIEAQVVAFSTTSSAASLSTNLKVVEKRLGVDRHTTSFVLPLGATMNMNGLSAYMGVVTIFTANLYGITLSAADMVTIIVTSTVASVGCAGVPSAALIVLPMVLSSAGLPREVIGMIAAVDRIIDMMSTTMNITGDSFTAVIVAKSEGTLNKQVYNDPTA